MGEFEQKQHGRLRNRCVIDLPATDQEPGSCKQCYHSRWPGKLVNSVDDGRNDSMCHFRLYAALRSFVPVGDAFMQMFQLQP